MKEFTLDEVDILEEMTGLPVDQLFPTDEDGNVIVDTDRPRAKVLIAMAYIVMKRENPDFTEADARKLTLTEATKAIEALNEDDDINLDG